MDVWTKIVTCHFSKQRMLRPSNHQPLQWALMVHPEGIQDAEKQVACHQTLSLCSYPQRCTLRGFRIEKNRILALDSSGEYQRNNFNKPRLLHLPIHRKALNSLTWDVWFSLIRINLLMFWLPVFVCLLVLQKLPYILVHPSLLYDGPSALSERLSPGLKSSVSHWIKHHSQFLGCAFFFQLTNDFLQSFWLIRLVYGAQPSRYLTFERLFIDTVVFLEGTWLGETPVITIWE